MSTPEEASNDDALEIEAIAAEFLERRRAGDQPSVEDYADRYPEIADELREVIPALLAMESMKRDWESSLHSQAPGGAVPVEKLGDYRLLREIGRGGMGIVYEATQESLNRKVALKLLPQHMLTSTDHVRRLQREARTAAALHHSNIVPVFGVGEEQGYHYIVMQLIDGVSVDHVIRFLREEDDDTVAHALTETNGSGLAELAMNQIADLQSTAPRSERTGTILSGMLTADTISHSETRIAQFAEQSVSTSAGDDDRKLDVPCSTQLPSTYWKLMSRLGIQIADAVGYAHEQGTLHRDIKPGNVLLDRQGTARITDFGLAHATDGSDVTNSQHLAGTITYMAPEQFSGEFDQRSDIYSLGLTLYELATLCAAVPSGSRAEMIRRASVSRPIAPRAHNQEIPRDLETIILKAIAPEPRHRYATADELADDLRRFCDDRPIRARRVTAAEKIWRWCRRNPVAAISSSISLTVLILAAVISFTAWSQEVENRRRIEAMLGICISSLEAVYDRFAPEAVSVSSYAELSSDSDSSGLPPPATLSPEAAAMLEELLPAFDELAKQVDDNDAVKLYAAEANQRIGQIHRQLGDYAEAVAAYERSLVRFEQLSNSMTPLESRIQKARIYNSLGITFREWDLRNRREQSEEAFRMAVATLAPHDDDGQPDIGATDRSLPAARRFELARTYYQLGRRILPEDGASPGGPNRPPRGGPPPRPQDFTDRPQQQDTISGQNPDHRMPPAHKEEEWIHRAIRELDALIEESDEPEYRLLLALCLRNLVHGYSSPERLQAIEILQQLYKEFPDSSKYAFELSLAYTSYPIEGILPSDIDAALKQMRYGWEQMEELANKSPGVVTYAYATAGISHRYSRVLGRSAIIGDPLDYELIMDEAIFMARRAVDWQKAAIRRSRLGKAEYHGLELFSRTLARMLQETNRGNEAREMLQINTAFVESALMDLDGEDKAAMVKFMSEPNVAPPGPRR